MMSLVHLEPFAFTGYQENEVSGPHFAQARYYSAETGRFQSEDNVKGFIESLFTQNHYGYCWGNPVGLVDLDGNWPKWVTKATDTVKDAAKATGKWWSENKSTVAKVAVTVGVASALVAGVVLAPGAVGFVCAAALASGALACATGNISVLFCGNAIINGAAYVATQKVNDEEISGIGLGVNAVIGGFVFFLLDQQKMQ